MLRYPPGSTINPYDPYEFERTGGTREYFARTNVLIAKENLPGFKFVSHLSERIARLYDEKSGARWLTGPCQASLFVSTAPGSKYIDTCYTVIVSGSCFSDYDYGRQPRDFSDLPAMSEGRPMNPDIGSFKGSDLAPELCPVRNPHVPAFAMSGFADCHGRQSSLVLSEKTILSTSHCTRGTSFKSPRELETIIIPLPRMTLCGDIRCLSMVHKEIIDLHHDTTEYSQIEVLAILALVKSIVK